MVQFGVRIAVRQRIQATAAANKVQSLAKRIINNIVDSDESKQVGIGQISASPPLYLMQL
jgi:hypothetical protein